MSTKIIDQLPKGSSNISDQLKRASISIPLNIAEACGKTGNKDRSRFFSIARGSAMECGAIMDVCKSLGMGSDKELLEAKKYLVRVVSMLTKIC